MEKIKRNLLKQIKIQSRGHGHSESAECSKDSEAPQNVATVSSKSRSEIDKETIDFYNEGKFLGEEIDDVARKPRSGQTKHHSKISADTNDDLVSKSGQASIKKSTMEKNHMRVNLEPIRAQFMSYLSLLKKMTINHP